MTQPRTLIIIPTYNEKDNVAQMVQAILSLKNGYHILFIDDNSPDGTAHHIEMLMEKHPEVFLEKRPGKLGLGTAYIHGFKWALQRDYVYIIEMDCDFSHDPKDLPRLVEACQNGADVAVGSRYAWWTRSQLATQAHSHELFCKRLCAPYSLDQYQGYYRRIQMLSSQSALRYSARYHPIQRLCISNLHEICSHPAWFSGQRNTYHFCRPNCR